MEIILSQKIISFTGSIGKGFGYYIRQSRNKRFFGQRSKHTVPPDGHLRFLFACAELAKHQPYYISDIIVFRDELRSALNEANKPLAAADLRLSIYHAADVINLQKTYGL